MSMRNRTIPILLALATALATVPSVAQSPGPLLHLKADGDATDATGNGYDGTLVGGVAYAAGVNDQAFSFDGTTGTVLIDGAGLPFGSQPRTISLWIHPTPNSWEKDANVIFHTGGTSRHQAFSLDMASTAEGRLNAAPEDRDGTYFMQLYTWDDDVWFDTGLENGEGWIHVGVVYDGNRTIAVYIAGVKRVEKVLTGVLNTPVTSVHVGNFPGQNWGFDGRIDDFKFFDYALTEDQIIDESNPNEAPDVTAAAPSQGSLWPPNNKMVDITIEGVIDADGDDVTIEITGITNDETGTADAEGIGTDTAQVRAARDGKGSGRTYTITFLATDSNGASSEGSVQVTVAHDQGKGKAKGRAKSAATAVSSWGEIKSSVR